MKTAGCLTFVYLLIAVALGSIGATSLRAQEYVRDSEPKLLDWFFVKADIDTPRDAKGPYLLAPHFARTLVNHNNCPPEPIADHSPMTVDLPFSEPSQLPAKVKAQ